MENAMTRLAGTLVLAAVGTLTAVTPDPRHLTRQDFDKFEKAYLVSLEHPNPGVVQSALYCILKLHHDFPQRSFTRLDGAIANLSKSGSTPQIRYKANIVSLHVRNKALMNQLDGEAFRDPSSFWTKLVGNIEAVSPEDLKISAVF